MSETTGREIPDKDIGTTRWLAADFLRYVSDGEIHRVCGLSSKDGQLRLVSRNDEGNDSCSRLLLL